MDGEGPGVRVGICPHWGGVKYSSSDGTFPLLSTRSRLPGTHLRLRSRLWCTRFLTRTPRPSTPSTPSDHRRYRRRGPGRLSVRTPDVLDPSLLLFVPECPGKRGRRVIRRLRLRHGLSSREQFLSGAWVSPDPFVVFTSSGRVRDGGSGGGWGVPTVWVVGY